MLPENFLHAAPGWLSRSAQAQALFLCPSNILEPSIPHQGQDRNLKRRNVSPKRIFAKHVSYTNCKVALQFKERCRSWLLVVDTSCIHSSTFLRIPVYATSHSILTHIATVQQTRIHTTNCPHSTLQSLYPQALDFTPLKRSIVFVGIFLVSCSFGGS